MGSRGPAQMALVVRYRPPLVGWLGGRGSPVYPPSLSIFFGRSAPCPAPRVPWLPQRPLCPSRTTVLTSSLVGAPGRLGCGSLCPRPGDQHFLEYSFPGWNHPVDFSELHSYLVLPAKLMGKRVRSEGFCPPRQQMVRMWQRRGILKLN